MVFNMKIIMRLTGLILLKSFSRYIVRFMIVI